MVWKLKIDDILPHKYWRGCPREIWFEATWPMARVELKLSSNISNLMGIKNKSWPKLTIRNVMYKLLYQHTSYGDYR